MSGSIPKCVFSLHALQEVAFRELFEKEKPAVFWWALLCQSKANAEPGCGQITATFSHTEQGSVMGCQGHFIKFLSLCVRFAYKIQRDLQGNKYVGKLLWSRCSGYRQKQ